MAAKVKSNNHEEGAYLTTVYAPARLPCAQDCEIPEGSVFDVYDARVALSIPCQRDNIRGCGLWLRSQ